MKSGKVVIVLQGRYAGRKAVIVKNFAEGAKDRKYMHCIVAGIDKYPRLVTRAMSERKMQMRTRIKPFVKLYNYNHLMPTRYTVDVDLKQDVTLKSVTDPTAKKAALKKVKEVLQTRYLTGKNKWFFSKLRF